MPVFFLQLVQGLLKQWQHYWCRWICQRYLCELGGSLRWPMVMPGTPPPAALDSLEAQAHLFLLEPPVAHGCLCHEALELQVGAQRCLHEVGVAVATRGYPCWHLHAARDRFLAQPMWMHQFEGDHALDRRLLLVLPSLGGLPAGLCCPATLGIAFLQQML
jgi:hypothetical protein